MQGLPFSISDVRGFFAELGNSFQILEGDASASCAIHSVMALDRTCF